MEVLRHFVGKFQESWEDWLPHVAASINGSVCSSTGKAPHSVIYGFDKRLPYDVLLQIPRPVYNVDDYAKVLIHSFQKIYNSVRDKLQASRADMIKRQHSRASPVTFAVGDTVMKRSPERSSKLSPKFTGPFQIIEKLHGNKFKVLHPQLNTSEIIHSDRLKKFEACPSQPNLPSSSSVVG